MAIRSTAGHDASLPEQALVERAREGDRRAFEELVRRHAERLYAVILRFTASPEEAEEALQEALLRAWRGIGRFQQRSQFFTWLYRIGINEAKRQAARRPPAGQLISTEEGAIEELADHRAGPQERAVRAELQAAIERAIRALAPEYRLPLVLRDIEGLSTTEAASVMELSEAAFKSRLHRARLAVREAVEPYLLEHDASDLSSPAAAEPRSGNRGSE